MKRRRKPSSDKKVLELGHLSDREKGIVDYLFGKDPHRHCKDGVQLVETSLDEGRLLLTRVKSSPLIFGISDQKEFSAAAQIGLICGSTLELKVIVTLEHGKGYRVEVIPMKITGGGALSPIGGD